MAELEDKLILCLDFDGVLHSYTSGWQGANVIPDPPVSGAVAFLREAAQHFQVCVFSSRTGQPGGLAAMKRWLSNAFSPGDSEIDEESARVLRLIQWPTEKPPAFLTIDDRALTFTGEWPSMETLRQFKPWNKKAV